MTLTQLETLTWARLNDAAGTYYPNVLGALNEALRLFSLLTFSVEATETVALSAATPVFNLLPLIPSFLRVRRIFNSSGTQLRPATLAELEALDSAWQNTAGAPTRYVLTGLDCLAIYPQPAATDTLTITFATTAAPLASGSDVPRIRPASHYSLASYAAYAVRQIEGGQEFDKFQGLLQEYFDEAREVAELVKHRNRDTAHELPPFELARTKR